MPPPPAAGSSSVQALSLGLSALSGLPVPPGNPALAEVSAKPSIPRIRELIKLHAPYFKRMLQVGDWKTTFRVEKNPPGEDFAASVVTDIDYHKATIRIHPENADSEDDVVDSIRHELLHLVLEPYDVYREAVYALLPKRARAAEERLWRFAMERAVLKLEELLDHGVYPLLREPPPGLTRTHDPEVLP